MLLVFVSHFGLMYFLPAGAASAQKIASSVALPSAALFVLLSGMMLGILVMERGSRFRAQRIKLVDRGLFLLLPADLVIRFAHRWVDRGMGPGARWVFMTDAIGVCLVVVPWIVTRIRGWKRVALGALLLATSWWAYFAWVPTGLNDGLLKAALVGDRLQKGAVFALVPWMGAYIMATVAGERLAAWRRAGQPIVGRLMALACACAAPSAIAHGLRHGHGPVALDLLSAGQKYPPSPSFLVGSAGLGFAILAAAAWVEDRGLFRSVFAVLALLGRASLVVFVGQYFVYYVGFFLLRLPMSPFWPVYFAVSVAINLACAWLWDAKFSNRYLTVGLPRLVERRATVSGYPTSEVR
jgi:hypothetical protein